MNLTDCYGVHLIFEINKLRITTKFQNDTEYLQLTNVMTQNPYN